MAIQITFACGHHGTVAESASAAPRCGCGETQVSRVMARPPRFRGACSGPYAETCMVDSITVSLASQPLKLASEKE